MDVVCQGPGCGRTFQTSSTRAKFCGSTCRSRGHRAGGETVVELSPPEAGESSDLARVTRRELVSAGVLDTILGQQAMALVSRIMSPSSTGASVASLSKELRTVMSEAMADVKVAADPLDELRARRDRKRTG